MSAERRQHPRFVASMWVLVSTHGHTQQFEATAGDISRGGIFVTTKEAIQVGQPVDLVIDSPVGVIATSGRVAHSIVGYGIGVEFCAQSPRTADLITACIAERQKA